MQSRWTNKLTTTSGTLGTLWTKFSTKFCNTVNLYVYNFSKILSKLHIHDHFLPIFVINFINLLAKTTKYKKSFKRNIPKTVCPI